MVLDSSALLAYLHQEQGGLQVRPLLPFAFMSTVNWCEVAQKLRAKSTDDKPKAKITRRLWRHLGRVDLSRIPQSSY